MASPLQNMKLRLRVYYKKTGVLAYISHLELLRSIEASIRRSGLPFCVSEGYSPHMKISFGPALSVGIESENQVFDIYLYKYVKPQLALEALQKSSAKDLCPTNCEYVDNSLPAISAEYGQTSYLVEFEANVDKLQIPEHIKLIKKGKEKIINVCDYLVDDIHLESNNSVKKMNFCLKSTSNGSLKPDIFVDAVLKNSSCSEYKIINFKKL